MIIGRKSWIRAENEQGTIPTERGSHAAGGDGGVLKVTIEEEAQVAAEGVAVVAGGATVNAEAGGALTAAAAQPPAETGAGGAAVGGATAGGGATGIVTADTAGRDPGTGVKAGTTGVSVITAVDTEDTATAGIGATPDDAKCIQAVFVFIKSHPVVTVRVHSLKFNIFKVKGEG